MPFANRKINDSTYSPAWLCPPSELAGRLRSPQKGQGAAISIPQTKAVFDVDQLLLGHTTQNYEAQVIEAESRQIQVRRDFLGERTRLVVADADVFTATAARISAWNARALIGFPSAISIARRVLPSRLALNKPAGSGSDAPLANVSFTVFL
jgi:hypothetical protein